MFLSCTQFSLISVLRDPEVVKEITIEGWYKDFLLLLFELLSRELDRYDKAMVYDTIRALLSKNKRSVGSLFYVIDI